MDNLDLTGLFNNVSSGVMNLVIALALLLVFYIVARVVSGAIRKVLSRTNLDNRLSETLGGDSSWGIEGILAKVVFWVIMLFGIMAFLTRLQLDMVAGPLQGMLDSVMGFLPNIFGALILGAIAFVLATVVKMVVTKGADSLELDKRLGQFDAAVDGPDHVDGASANKTSIGAMLGTALFGLIILMFLPSILDKLGMGSITEPLNGMMSTFLDFIPNLIGAAIIFAIGYFVAGFLRNIIGSVLGGMGVDSFGERAGLNMSLSGVIGTLVYTFILLMTIVQALNKLGIDAISGPATSIIEGLFGAIPNIIGAALTLGISFIVAKIIAGLISGLLSGVGFDGVPAKLGLNLSSKRTPSEMAGMVVIAAVMLLATLTATDMLGIPALSGIVGTFIGFAGQILVGMIVMGIGLWIANLAGDFARSAGMSKFVASLIRGVVMVLVGSMALTAVGIGEDIVQLAFGIGLGAIGIAAALAFGLGSREIAGREMERFVTSVRSGDEN